MVQQFLRMRDVQSRTGLARATIYLRMSQGRFPKPIPLGSTHTVGWLATEVDGWIQEQIRAARGSVDGAHLTSSGAA